jgi:hypothetical protein
MEERVNQFPCTGWNKDSTRNEILKTKKMDKRELFFGGGKKHKKMGQRKKRDSLNVRGVTCANIYMQTHRILSHRGMEGIGKLESTLHVSRTM